MAIAFARPEYVGRSDNKNACCKSSYNSRSRVVDQKIGKVFDFTNHGGNVYHEILLPEYVDKKFKNAEEFSNEVERAEKRKDSQLYVEWLLALPKEKEITLAMKKEIIKEFIQRKGWVKEGLGVQIDIHKPHEGEVNWHAHLLVTTRRYKKDGLGLEDKKAVDLQPEVKYGKVQKTAEIDNHKFYENVLNDKFKEWGLDLRADLPGDITQEHIGPVRMRSVMNEAVMRNETRKEANIEYLNSGSRVLERVTAHMSVFNRKDLERAVKIVPDSEIRVKLVEDALSSKSLISLYDESCSNTGYYTTNKIRAEEEKLLRLSGYVANQKNSVAEVCANKGGIRQLLSTLDFSLEQEQALSELVFNEPGLRILRGRAGTGKSHVLGEFGNIAREYGINVIGLAPTHKAKNELASRGYEQNDTIKGMLFKLHNGRFDLPKNSVLVVDEAGMIGNDDFKELLRVAASRKCNVILSGDEKQLASVQRGGMFEVFADSYGNSSILKIRRQEDAWGRDVAMAFSKGEVSTGIAILQAHKKLILNVDKMKSMQSLLADWDKSKEKLTDRLIIAVKNSDVAAFNDGARQYLKRRGLLQGTEIAVAGSHYMQGDRILIRQTNKDLGLVNGDFASVIQVSKKRFIISLEGSPDNGDKVGDNRKIVEFNPSKYNGFKHGYATTVFKAQGASINDVYVFHDGFAGIRNSYVALSRNVRDLKLYINNQDTKSVAHLSQQLGHDPEIGSSLSYLSREDFKNRELDKAPKQDKGIVGNLVTGVLDYTSKRFTEMVDKHIPNSEYYHYKAPELKREKVETVLDVVAKEMSEEAVGNVIALEERAVAGGNSNPNSRHYTINPQNSSNLPGELYSNNTKQTAKESFYAKADYVRKQSNNLERKAKWDADAERLRSEVKYNSESIAIALLGEPNKSLSSGTTLRFGDHGRVAVGISGERIGSWYDFSRDKGGDMFSLVQDKQGCDFKGAAEYLRQSVGIEVDNNSHLQLVDDHRNKDLTKDHVKAKIEKERINKAKAVQVDKLYSRAKDIGNQSVAYKYLTQSRGLDLSIGIGEDIKTTGIYVRNEAAEEFNSPKEGKYLPAIVAFARDSEGNVTGGQQILLNKSSGTKANIEIPKKSFGRIAGSFVDVEQVNSMKSSYGNHTAGLEKEKITIIAEGIETALSVRQGLREHNERGAKTKTLCSLGISNIKNYQPNPGEKIVIAADNDGIDAFTNKTIENARLKLEEKGAFVKIVRPSKEGDFNDLLKSDGVLAISADFASAINKHKAKTLEEYFTRETLGIKLDEHDKSNLLYIEKYDLPQNAIVDAYRQGDISGKFKLEQSRKGLEKAANHFSNNQEILKESRRWGYQGTERTITKQLIGMDESKAKEHCLSIVGNTMKGHMYAQKLSFQKEKDDANNPEGILAILHKENEFLANHQNKLQYFGSDDKTSKAIEFAVKEISTGHEMGEIKNALNFAEKIKINSTEVMGVLKKPGEDLVGVKNSLTKLCVDHHRVQIQHNLDTIKTDGFIRIDKVKFTNQVKYLEHLSSSQQAFLPKNRIDKALNNVYIKQKELSKDMGGMSM